MATLRYRAEIDGLRAIAVAAVVIYHAAPAYLPGGFIGVDVFFAISGYLITAILAREWQVEGRIDLAGFYHRRMRRLLPALFTVLLVTVVAGCVLLPPLQLLQPLVESAIASALFVANFYFQWHTGGYFDAGVERWPLLHLWSLAVEEQFYLVYPLLLVLLLRYARSGKLLALGLLSLGSLALAEHWLQVSPESAFYQMPSRFWELAIGCMIALSPGRAIGGTRASVQAAVGLVLIGASAVLLRDESSFPGLAALPPVAGAALVLHAVHGASETGVVGRLLCWRPMVVLGLISYPLYLWHWPLLVMDQSTRLAPESTGWRLFLCLVAVVLAWLTYRFVELPFRRRRAVTPWVGVRRGMISTAAVVTALVWLTTLELGAKDADLVSRTRRDRPLDMVSCHFNASSRVSDLAPDSCQSRHGYPVRVAIWGDSHALAWKPLAWDMATHAGVAAEAHTMDACPPVHGIQDASGVVRRLGENCAVLNARVAAVVGSGQYDVLILAARWPSHFGAPMLSVAEHARQGREGRQFATPDEVRAGLRQAVDLASRHVRRVILLGPTPVLRFEAPDCLGTGRLSQCEVSRAEFEARAKPAMDTLRQLAADFPNVEVVDPAAFFCPDAVCLVARDGYGLFWDDDHVSSTAARNFAAEFIARPGDFQVRSPSSHSLAPSEKTRERN